LIVERDAVLGQVLGRVLAREGISIVHAANAAQALQLAKRHSPRLAVLDCCEREGNDLQLARDLHDSNGGLAVIVMTDDRLRVNENLMEVSRFARILIKPINLQHLRQAVDAAIADTECGMTDAECRSPFIIPRSSFRIFKELPMRDLVIKMAKAAAFVVFILVVLTGFAMATGAVRVPWQGTGEKSASPPKPVGPGVELVEGQPHTLAVPDDVLIALGIRKGNKDMIAVAKKPTQMRPLVMPGSTALDPTRLFRIRARFAPSPSSAECVEIAQVPEDPAQSGKAETALREIRSGDKVKKGDLQ